MAIRRRHLVVLAVSSASFVGGLVAGSEGVAVVALLVSMAAGGMLVMNYLLASMAIAESADRLWVRRGWKWQSVPWTALRGISFGSFRGIWTVDLCYVDDRRSNVRCRHRHGHAGTDGTAHVRRLMLLLWLFPPWTLYPVLRRNVSPSLQLDPGAFRAIFASDPYPSAALLNARGRHQLPAEMSATPTVAAPLAVATWPSLQDRQFGVHVALAASAAVPGTTECHALANWADGICERAAGAGAWWLSAFVAVVHDESTPPEGGLWVAVATARLGEAPNVDTTSSEMTVGHRRVRCVWGDRRHEISVPLNPSNVWLNVVSEHPADPGGQFPAVLVAAVAALADGAESRTDNSSGRADRR